MLEDQPEDAIQENIEMDPGLNIKNQTSDDSNQQMTSQLGGSA